MLTKIAKTPKEAKPATGRFVIIAAKYNPRYTDALVRFARAEFKAAGLGSVKVYRVPGAFESPVIASHLVRAAEPYDAIVCFGVIMRGATSHADHIATGVTHALAQLQVDTGVPIIHGVLMFDKPEHAEVRCVEAEHNRGTEAARTAMEMARVVRSIGPTN